MKKTHTINRTLNLGLMAVTSLLLFVNNADAYSGRLNRVFGDIKRPMANLQGRITNGNHQAIINGLRNNLQCNGTRNNVLMQRTNTSQYGGLIRTVRVYTKGRGMRIYGNPLGTPGDWPSNIKGNNSGNRARYADRIAAYVRASGPSFTGCFNESGFATNQYVDIRDRLARAVRTTQIGTDVQKTASSLNQINNTTLETEFNIWASHNAEQDNNANRGQWNRIADRAGREAWASENPRNWNQNYRGSEVGIKAVVDSRIRGLVIYLGHPASTNTSGALTSKGRGIRNGIGNRE